MSQIAEQGPTEASVNMPTTTLGTRLRRLRRHPGLRALVRETSLQVTDLVLPLFVKQGLSSKVAIASMPGHFQLSLQDLPGEIDALSALQIPGVMLFGIPTHKDAQGSGALAADGIVQQAISVIKQRNPEMLVIADLCFCEYTDHGHCGVIQPSYRADEWTVDNDATLILLGQQAVSLARAGADVIAPSGMIDGMVAAVRTALDQAGFQAIPILSYAVKYASAFYGPFREAAEGSPQMGDRSGYQMDIANSDEALREAKLDVAEGADMLMVKPAHSYLDIIYRVKHTFPEIPLAAYQVSGEFAMLKAAAEKGWLDEQRVMMESLIAIKRAGANFIISYFAKQAAALLGD